MLTSIRIQCRHGSTHKIVVQLRNIHPWKQVSSDPVEEGEVRGCEFGHVHVFHCQKENLRVGGWDRERGEERERGGGGRERGEEGEKERRRGGGEGEKRE